MSIELINIEQLPGDDANINSKIMFGIGELLHTTTISQIATLINAEAEAPLNTIKLVDVFPHEDFNDDFAVDQLFAVKQAINFSLNEYYGGTITADAGQAICFRLLQSSFIEPEPGLLIPAILWRYYTLTSGELTFTGIDDPYLELRPDGTIQTEPDLFIDLGSIGASNVWEAFNADGDAPFTMTVSSFIKAVTNEGTKVWKWNGGEGLFGGIGTPAVAQDFILLNPSPVIGIPYLQAQTITDATRTLQAVDLNRTTTFTNAVTVTIPNDVFLIFTSTRQQAWLSFKSTGTINYPTTDGVGTLAVTAGALVYVERRGIGNEWIVKRVDNVEDDNSKWDVVYDNQYGLRVPTSTEWENERTSWSSVGYDGAFGSPLKLTTAGRRNAFGNIQGAGADGIYWSSTIFGNNSSYLTYVSGASSISSSPRREGMSMRLIVDGTFTLQEFEDDYENEIWQFQGLDYGFVYNPTTEKIWLDRNLGASQVATSRSDTDAYGDLYQWGRSPEGHQLRAASLHDGDVDGKPTFAKESGDWDGKFIITSASPNDWLNPQDNNLWQGLAGFAESFDIPEKLIGKNGLKASYLDLLDLPTIPVLPNTIVESVTGDLVDNTDPANPIVETPTLQEAYDAEVVPTEPITNLLGLNGDGDVVKGMEIEEDLVSIGKGFIIKNLSGDITARMLSGFIEVKDDINLSGARIFQGNIELSRPDGLFMLLNVPDLTDNRNIEFPDKSGIIALLGATADTGVEIDFTTPKIFNSPASPETGNITDDLTGALIGIVQKIYHNSATIPTVPAGWVLIGDKLIEDAYLTGYLNIIYAEWVSGTRVEYRIVSGSPIPLIVNPFKTRVIDDGGTFEAESCLITQIQELI
jgi:hypothetical protein